MKTFNCLFFSITEETPSFANWSCLPKAMEELGMFADSASHESLRIEYGELVCTNHTGTDYLLEEFELIWLLGLGERSTFLDRMQLLKNFNSDRFVNSIDSYVYRHAKGGLFHTSLIEFQPETIVSDNPDVILSHMVPGKKWIIKPNAGSFGDKVFGISPEDENARSIIETVCRDGYALLQKRVDTKDEKRVLVSAGKVIGCYGKQGNELRKNIATGTTAVKATLTDFERLMANKVASKLLELEIRFAALDIAYPYLLDVNIVNPGFLGTYQTLTGINLATKVCESVLEDMFGLESFNTH